MSKNETPMTRWYWKQVGGTLIEEFIAVHGGADRGIRVLDAIILPFEEFRIAKQYEVSIEGKDVVVVQTKSRRLGMGLLGQALFSAQLVQRFHPRSALSVALPNWQDALLVAIIDLPFSLQVEGVLKAWFPKTTDNIIFTDFAFYKIVRYLPKGNETRNRWIEHCMTIALNTKNFSLIESLILVLRQDALNHSELIAIAKEYAKTSAQMRRVLLNACNLKVKDLT